MPTIADNYTAVTSRITAAAERAGRDPASVRLVAVTKTVGLDEIRALAELGHRDMGENRVLPGSEKAGALAGLDLSWHFIGHLQRNKAGKALAHFRMIHSVESPRLIEVLQRHAEKLGVTVQVLIEVNVSGEESKFGLANGETGNLVLQAAARHNLEVQGLMTMAPFTGQAEAIRPVFRGLRELRDRIQDETGIFLPELSMGMSNDFEVAVEEGATMVRIGSALFN